MKTVYDSKLKAYLRVDEDDRVRGINHREKLWASQRADPLSVAVDYVQQMADTLAIPKQRVERLKLAVDHLNPKEQDVEYRRSGERSMMGSTTVGFDQTCLNVPVWGSGVTVTLKHNPFRVVSVQDTSRDAVRPKLPSKEAVERFRSLAQTAAVETEAKRVGFQQGRTDQSATATFVRKLVDRRRGPKESAPPQGEPEGGRDARVIRSRFFIYSYDPDERLPPREDLPEPAVRGVVVKARSSDRQVVGPNFMGESQAPTLPLAPVDKSIKAGKDYLVSEVTFTYATQAWNDLVWQALVDVGTGSVLYLRPLASEVNAQVFYYDPITSTGDAGNTPSQTSAVLNTARTTQALDNLAAAEGGQQLLVGSYAAVQEVSSPTIGSPAKPSGTDFIYDARTDDFAAVNAYYHQDRFFRLMESLGFPLATYFPNTTFPVPVDHRGSIGHGGSGIQVNAHCVGNGLGGIGHCCYALADTANTTDPMGIATDWRVHLHELGGHGVLYEYVNSPNFGFSHSAGDSLAVILNDPESAIHNPGATAPDRFVLAPFVPAVNRRHDRDVAAGWAWGGNKDVGGYNSEQVLSTTLFRLYRSIGGDSPHLSRRKFAARMSAYLILRAISTLTPATNPTDASGFEEALEAVDQLNWTSEGIFGGAYKKVIRWAFEKQGLFQPAGAPTPVAAAGAPPEVDVYIDDGRGGEYPFQAVHWANPSIWNRNSPDGLPGHQPSIPDATNFIYVKIKNRGTQTAHDVKIRGFHSKPGAGLSWPGDFTPLSTPDKGTGPLPGNNGEERVIGPFAWEPNVNAYGHDCILMVVSADGDASNVDNFTVGESIQEWRLVPNDNNIGQRNVNPAPGGGGMTGLLEGLRGRSFFVGNPDPRPRRIRIEAELPAFLAERGWRMTFRESSQPFELQPGEKREVFLELHAGKAFETRDVHAAGSRDIRVTALADGAPIGGMVYHVDPDLKQAPDTHDRHAGKEECLARARELLACLKVPDAEAADVRIRRVMIDVDMERPDNC